MIPVLINIGLAMGRCVQSMLQPSVKLPSQRTSISPWRLAVHKALRDHHPELTGGRIRVSKNLQYVGLPPLNLRAWPRLTIDDGLELRRNINTAALVTIVQCNTFVVRCSRQLIGPADWVFVTLGPLRCD